jgi:hypothetical protein
MQAANTGAIQLDVREETRHTEAVGGSVVELVPAAREDWQNPLRRVVTDTAGRTVFAGLVPARYAVRVWAVGHDTVTQRLNVKRGEVEALHVRLRDDRCTPVVTQNGVVCM